MAELVFPSLSEFPKDRILIQAPKEFQCPCVRGRSEHCEFYSAKDVIRCFICKKLSSSLCGLFSEGECEEFNNDMKNDEYGIDIIRKLYHPYDKMCFYCGLKYFDTTDKGRKEQLPCWLDIKILTRENNDESDSDTWLKK